MIQKRNPPDLVRGGFLVFKSFADIYFGFLKIAAEFDTLPSSFHVGGKAVRYG